MMVVGRLVLSSVATPLFRIPFVNLGWYKSGCWCDHGKGKRNPLGATPDSNAAAKKMKGIPYLACSAQPDSHNYSSRIDFYKEMIDSARDNFTREISFQSKDQDISLAKALLYVGAEDEAFLAFNRDIDNHYRHSDHADTSSAYDCSQWRELEETMLVDGKNIDECLAELDAIAKEVEAELVSRDIGYHTEEVVVKAVNKVLFELRDLKRSPVLLDPKCSYLHSALSSGWASGIMLSVIYIEVCRRLNLTIVGSRVGEEFLIWPSSGNPEELFRVTSGESLFKVVNGKCVDDPRSMASDINSSSLSKLDIAMNRDIIGITLANLIVSSSPSSLGYSSNSDSILSPCHILQRLYWKRASRANHGLMLTSPLRSVHKSVEKFNNNGLEMPLLRPQDLRLAVMASERLLLLEPHNWALRRDYGMLLYYRRDYEAAVQELSICLAFAPEEEAEVLEPFVEKLHLMRIEKSWGSLGQNGRLTVS